MKNSHVTRRHLLAGSIALTLGSALPTAWAQVYPDKPVKLAVGFAPGTGPDLLARTAGQQFADLIKQSVVVDNRSGAGGQIAAAATAKSPADGYNLLLADLSSISIAPAAFSKLPYDPQKQLIPVTEIARTDFVLVVPASSPARNMDEFARLAKAQGGKVNFATFGAGTPGHFGAVMLAEMAGYKTEVIHYRQTADVITALGSAEVQGALMSTPLAMAQVKGGKMRALATTAAKRSALLPEVPTFTESGYPKADFSAWFVIFVPAGTSQPVMDLVQREMVKAVQTPETRKRLEEAGFTVSGSSQAEARKMVQAETVRWAEVVRNSGFRGD